MKKTLIYALFSLTLLFYSQLSYGKEIRLETDIHWISQVQLDTRAKHFNSFFEITKGGNFANSYDIVPYSIFQSWESGIPTGGVNDDYIHVLRIYYGMDTLRSKIILIYLPDYATRVGTTNVFRFHIPDPLADNTPVYSSLDLRVPTTYGAVKQYVANYQEIGRITLNEYGVRWPAPAGRRPLSFATGGVADDAKGVVFSFREVEDFFEDLNGNVYVINAASQADQHGVDFYKHSIAFSSAAPGTTPPVPPAPAIISADLGALCPPKCNEINVMVHSVDFFGRFRYIILPLFAGFLAFLGFLLYRFGLNKGRSK